MQVNLTYFKPSGKYYCEGHYESQQREIWEIFDEVRMLRNCGLLPGLAAGAKDYHITVDVPNHPHSYPALILI